MSQNFVEFCLVASPCEDWQRSYIQHLRRAGKYDRGPYFLAVCGQKFIKFWKTVGDAS